MTADRNVEDCTRCVVITGASSGIGQALALRYAQRGVELGLLGRHPRRLEEVAVQCRSRGALVTTAAIDIRDRAAMAHWIHDFDAAQPISLLIANAGVMGGAATPTELESSDSSYTLIQTNVVGTLNTIHPVLPGMLARGRGQIAIISSIAAFIPLPDAPSYAASKAMLLSYGLALRGQLHDKGIKVSVICPGYVATPMTAQEHGWKPFEMSAAAVADHIWRGLERNAAVVAFPRFFALVTRIGGLLPERLRRWTSSPFRFTVDEGT